ncbi:MAG: carboxypeptidase regulatory-like domain-containing protein [Acidobacteriota bacterium]
MKNALKWSALIVVLALVASLSLIAQTTGGALQGKITDEKGEPVPGAVVRISGPTLQGTQGTGSDMNGEYYFPFLPPGRDYSIKVEAPGYATAIRNGVEIPLGTTIKLNFQLSTGGAEMVVTGAAPIIDTRKVETGANLSDTMITSIPLDRSSRGLAFLAPGAVTSGLANQPSFAGASGPENSYIVNGVEIASSADGRNMSNLNFDFIEAYEVKTGGMDAEFGGLMGGAINSITKSGGNEFHGGLFAYYWDDGLGAKERKLDNPTEVDYIKANKIYDIGGYLGGYILKDKLWFFAAYDWNKDEAEYTAEGTDANVTLGGAPSYSWARGTGYKISNKDPQYAWKLTYNFNENHRFVISFFGNQLTTDDVRNLNNPSSIASKYDVKRKNYGANIQWNATWTPKFFTEVNVGTRRSWFDSRPKNEIAANNWGYYYRYGSGTYAGYQVIPTGTNTYDPATGAINLDSWLPSLGGRTYEIEKDFNDQLRLKGTNLFNWAGKHELSYGLQYFDISYTDNFNYTGPGITETSQYDPFYGLTSMGGAVIRWQRTGTDLNGNGLADDYLFRAQMFMTSQNKETSQKYYAYWMQDNWQLTDYFMLKLGVRLDQIHMKGGKNLELVPNVVGTDPDGYPLYGTGHYADAPTRKVKINDEWAPRIGFTWDVFHNGKSKLYGFYGWYYERIPQDLAIRALTTEFFHFAYYMDPALTQTYDYSWTNGLETTQIVGGPNGEKLKGSYNKESILGLQYELKPDLNVGARLIYRSIGRVIEDISYDGAVTYIVTNPDKWTNIWVPDALGRPGYWWRFPKPVRIYKALELTLDKRFSNNWQMGGSYVLSRLHGNYEGLFSNDNGQLDPNITSKYDIPSLLVNGYGLLPNDRTHVLKLYGSYSFPFGLDLSGNFQLQSGTPISKLGADDAYGMNEGFCAPRGTAGRTPTTWTFDFGARYHFKLWKSDLGFRVDVLNLFNCQKTTAVDQTYNTENTKDVQTYPYFGLETEHQRARRVRFAIQWTF